MELATMKNITRRKSILFGLSGILTGLLPSWAVNKSVAAQPLYFVPIWELPGDPASAVSSGITSGHVPLTD
jgi:hypothetical protein